MLYPCDTCNNASFNPLVDKLYPLSPSFSFVILSSEL